MYMRFSPGNDCKTAISSVTLVNNYKTYAIMTTKSCSAMKLVKIGFYTSIFRQQNMLELTLFSSNFKL